MQVMPDDNDYIDAFDFAIPPSGVNEKDWELNEKDDRNVWLSNMLSDKQKGVGTAC